MVRFGWKEWLMVAVALLSAALWMALPSVQQDEEAAPTAVAVAEAPEPDGEMAEGSGREDVDADASEEYLAAVPSTHEIALGDGHHRARLYYPERNEAVAFLDIFQDGRRVFRQSYRGAHGGTLRAADCTGDGHPDLVVVLEGRRTSQVVVIMTEPGELPSRRLHRHEVYRIEGDPGPEGVVLVTPDGAERHRWDGYRFRAAAAP